MGWVRTLTRPEIWESTWEDPQLRLVSLPLNLILQYGGAGCRVRRSMARTLGPILKTLLFTILVPGFVTLYVPYLLLGRAYAPGRGPLAWLWRRLRDYGCRDLFPLRVGVCRTRSRHARTRCSHEIPRRDWPASICAQSHVHRRVAGNPWASCTVSRTSSCRVWGFVHSPRASVYPFLRRTHLAQAVRRVVRKVPRYCSAVDPAIQKVTER